MDILIGEIISIIDGIDKGKQSNIDLMNYLDTKSEELLIERDKFVSLLCSTLTRQGNEYREQMANKMLEIVTTEVEKEKNASKDILKGIITIYLSTELTIDKVIKYIPVYLNEMEKCYSKKIINKAVKEQYEIVSDKGIHDYIRKNYNLTDTVLYETTNIMRNAINIILTNYITTTRKEREEQNRDLHGLSTNLSMSDTEMSQTGQQRGRDGVN